MESFSDTPAQEQRGLRRWFVAALVVSLLLHAFLAMVFHASRLERFQAAGSQQERLVPRPFSIKPVKIDPKLFEPEPAQQAKGSQPAPTAPPRLPDVAAEKPLSGKLPEKVTLSPSATELAKPILNEKPSVEAAKIAPPKESAAVERELASVRNQLVSDAAPRIAPAPLAHPGEGGEPGGTREGTGRDVPGFSNLDDLLAQSGPLTGSVAPVNMPGGALFEYDRADLLPEAIATLRKLGELIKRNPRATFSIEGHSDSFGDPAYNQKLSETRAGAVKAWLVETMGVDPARIETRGFGSTRLLAPATGTREEQAINRRVEIVIRTPR